MNDPDYDWGLERRPGRRDNTGTDVDEPGLFELDKIRLAVGDEVTVQTMFGDEPATVIALTRSADGYPHVQVHSESGDTFTVSVARVKSLTT